MKKFFAVLMSIMMIACFMPTMAFADGEASTSGTVVAKIGETSYETLEAAINAAKDSNGGTIELQSDVRLNDLMPITGNVTINGNNKTITGVADNNQVGFVVTGGSFTINNATVTGFGKDAATATGVAVVKVPYDAAADTAVNLNNVKINNFCRSALDIRSGNFTVDGCEIDCKNENPNSLTKGILAGLATNKVTGTVKNTTITNSASTAEGWTSGAIEVKFNADVTVENCEINHCAAAFLVTAKWRGEQATDPTDTKEAKLTVKGGEYSAESRVLRADARDANNAAYNTTDTAVINVQGGNFTATGAEGLVFKKNGTPELTEIHVSGGTFPDLDVLNYADENADITVDLKDNVTLDKSIVVENGKLTINGNGKTITGVANDNQVGFVVNGGKLAMSNLTLTDFGKNTATGTGVAVIKVLDTAAADAEVSLNEVTIKDFCRSALDIRSGKFDLNGCEIDCKNTNPGSLTKGILAGLATNKVTGTVKNTTITNSDSTAEGWTSGAIEVKYNADVTVEGSTINNCATAFLVTAKWREQEEGDNTPRNAVLTVKSGDYYAASRVLRVDARDANGATFNSVDNATINVQGGTFTATGEEGLVFKKNGTPELTTISVSGGKFSQDPSEYTASGATMTKNADGTFTVTRRSSGGGGGGSSVTPTTPSQDVKTDTKTGTTTVATDVKVSEKTNADGTKEKVAEVKVSAANQKEILKQAKESKSKDIILSVSKSEVGDAGKADVTLDKSFIESVANDTDANLTIQTPFGEKTYTKEELKKLAAEATGSTITLTIEPAADDSAAKIEKAKEIVADMQLVARSSKTAKKSVKVVLKTDDATKASIEELKALGFTVEYKFYRSTKKAASYKATVTKENASYTNTVGKKGTKYFYKVRVVVSNGDGVVAQTALKQCKYASRTWTK